ncbi:MAG TPA: von Willebrand factor type A domain-containing protein [Verrucomicrobiota bacterium]|nr:VWA domain-containing protein [Verrucomicrobiales bacterium]HRI14652.1 von Willebrand factor type A domain-containing protein [Verrucomicrobiota bacterium]
MKLSPDSPELTAYVLGELSESERAEVETALTTQEELRAEIAALRAISAQVARELAAEPVVALSDDQRTALLEVAAKSAPPEPVAERSGKRRGRHEVAGLWGSLAAWRHQLIWMTAGACALMLTWALFWPQHVSKGKVSELRYQVQSLATPREELTEELTELRQKAPEAVNQPAPTRLADLPELTSATGIELTPSATPASAAVGLPGQKLEANVPEGLDTAKDSFALAPSKSPYAMDPTLARRYGLAPARQGDPGFRVQFSAPSEPTQERRLNLARGLDEKERLGRSVAEPEVKLHYYRELESRLPEQGVGGLRGGETPGTESYGQITDNPFKDPLTDPLSTFGLDVDTASYANIRRFLREGSVPPRDAVRLEELINYFHYDYPAPRGDEPFGSSIEIADCPWHAGHKLVRVGLQAMTIARGDRPRANLVFLLDVSGSMEPENKLPLVKRSLRLLLDRLNERDSVGIVTYAGESRVALEPTAITSEGRKRIVEVIESLRAGSGTAGAAGIVSAYTMAKNRLDKECVNRVILCTDGDFNIGITDPAALHQLITDQAKSGVFLSVLGYGMGNLKDSTMELLANKGNGNYAYIDSFSEARKVLAEQLEGTLVAVAKDVKVQLEFNPARVASYRLLGYENRILRDRDFNDDTKDAGEVGAGHQVTVLYEIVPATARFVGTDPLRYQPSVESDSTPRRLKPGHGDELLTLKLRYKAPDGDQSQLAETPVKDVDREVAQASADFRFAAAVAGYGMLLRNSPHKGDLTWDQVLRLAEQGLGNDKEGYRAEFVDLVRRAQQLSRP